MRVEAKINKSARSLTGFNGATTITIGMLELDVYSLLLITAHMFMIIDEVSPYNRILGKPWFGKINVITSAMHQKIHYSISWECVSQINSNQAIARKCSAQGLKKGKQTQFILVNHADLKGA